MRLSYLPRAEDTNIDGESFCLVADAVGVNGSMTMLMPLLVINVFKKRRGLRRSFCNQRDNFQYVFWLNCRGR